MSVPNQNWPDIALGSGSCFGPGTNTRIFHFHERPTVPYNCGAGSQSGLLDVLQVLPLGMEEKGSSFPLGLCI